MSTEALPRARAGAAQRRDEVRVGLEDEEPSLGPDQGRKQDRVDADIRADIERDVAAGHDAAHGVLFRRLPGGSSPGLPLQEVPRVPGAEIHVERSAALDPDRHRPEGPQVPRGEGGQPGSTP